MKEEITSKLAEIETKENVKILYAVESGSRAWGVASPDSDYDVRFIYVRTMKDYLSIQEKRDVIEWQLDDVLDINGWDLKKTLAQFHKGNATLYHYYGTANSTFKQYLQSEEVKYKKYVYALRPLLACKYIEEHHSVSPVKFDDLLRQNLPRDLSLEIEKMLEVKTKGDEIDLNPKMPVIQKLIEDELVRYEQVSKNMPDDRNPDWETLDRVFLRMLT